KELKNVKKTYEIIFKDIIKLNFAFSSILVTYAFALSIVKGKLDNLFIFNIT
ncbi:unnamed protein product, partial [Arabidopsis halleri]